MKLKLTVHNREYTHWTWYDADELTEKEVNLIPLEYNLFYNDVIEYNDNNVKILHSTIRNIPNIAGVLMLEDKTFGRSKNNKLIYKCIPDDKRLPIFLVPYEDKKTKFNKKKINKYVTFQYKEWNEKHPCGILNEVIGDVSDLSKFYEYQLYCKSLNASIQNFTKVTKQIFKNKPSVDFIDEIMNTYKIEDRTDNHTFTIDSIGTQDYDDGFGIVKNNDHTVVTVYIANVVIWMEYLNLWKSFSERVSTIYLPDRKRPMLPSILSEQLCSLNEKNRKFVFYMDLHINNITHKIDEIKYGNALIKISKNYCYEKYIDDKDYIMLFDITQHLSKNYKILDSITTSGDLVHYYMMLMNHNCAEEMGKYKKGIYRSFVNNDNSRIVPENLSEEITKFIKIWQKSYGAYCKYSEDREHNKISRDIKSSYLHITSPIRRLVDLINMSLIMVNLNIFKLSDEGNKFIDKWINKLDYINTTMRAIKKIQCDSSLLEMCTNNYSIINSIYNGYIFDKIPRNDGLYQYTVYIPKIKMVSRITLRENEENYTNYDFKLYLFHDESSFKRKIRLQLI